MNERRPPGNISFQSYLAQYNLTPLEVAKKAGIHYVTVWNITINRPVTVAHATQVRSALYMITGVAYDGPITTLP
jgi:plasmid maintenance system antidote protein VapI